MEPQSNLIIASMDILKAWGLETRRQLTGRVFRDRLMRIRRKTAKAMNESTVVQLRSLSAEMAGAKFVSLAHRSSPWSSFLRIPWNTSGNQQTCYKKHVATS